MELFSVFTTPPMVKVFWGKQELGEVHQLTFAVRDNGPALLTLGGRSWQTTYIDWPRKKAFVEPSEVRGKSQWVSDAQPLRYELCRAIADALVSDLVPEGLSSRAQGLLADLRDQYGWMESGKSTLIFDTDGNATWWNFAGKLLNSAMKDLLADEADKLIADNECLNFRHVYSYEALVSAIREILAGDAHDLAVLLDEAFVQELKFAECLSQKEIDRELGERYSVDGDFSQFSRISLAVLWVKEEA
ncbi:hypothetical protein P4118_29485 [Pseudomonas aeruginosa]|nr:hypothetical protein [Pseudomonas aeruginosa]